MIVTDSFEDGFYAFDGIDELTCPMEWEPDWVDGTEPGVNHRPEYKPKKKPQEEIFDGEFSASIHTRFASHDGVLWRQFSVTPGVIVRASVYAMGKGSGGGHGMVLGIDPRGHINHTDQGVVWSDWWSQDENDWAEGKWKQVAVEIIPQSSTITVFLRSKAREKAELSAAHFDLFQMYIEDDDPPPEGGVWEHIENIRNAVDQLEDYLKENQKACIVLGDV